MFLWIRGANEGFPLLHLSLYESQERLGMGGLREAITILNLCLAKLYIWGMQILLLPSLLKCCPLILLFASFEIPQTVFMSKNLQVSYFSKGHIVRLCIQI